MSKYMSLTEAKVVLKAAEVMLEGAQAAYVAAGDKRAHAQRLVRDAERSVREARVRDAKNKVSRDRSKAKRLAAQYGIEIEIDRIDVGYYHYWVTGPEGVYPNDVGDPWEGDHIGTSWSEVLNRVEVYVEDLKAKQAA